MPSKFLIRNLIGNSYYHVYNRGVDNENREHKKIFLDNSDYETFLYYLYIYSGTPANLQEKYPDLPKRLKTKNMAGEIYLVAYCLMPDHFHLLLKQNSQQSMPKYIKQIVNAYITYFNKKYKHSGTIFAGRYKSVRIATEYLLLQITRYIHLNPLVSKLIENPKDYRWSSYVNHDLTNGIINRFKNFEEWEKFHTDRGSYEQNFEKIKQLTID